MLHDVVDQLLAVATVPVMGIGLGTIGHVDTDGRLPPQNFESMYEAPLKQLLTERHGLPVSVRTGASAAAVGEYFARKQRDAAQSLAFVVIDYGGIGLGLISDDVLWSNRSGLSEFGHIVIDYNGRPCECGRQGCLASMPPAKQHSTDWRSYRKVDTGIGMAQLADLAENGDCNGATGADRSRLLSRLWHHRH